VTPEERTAALERIAEEVRVCTACRLHGGRTRAVPGEGHPDTEVVFVGEGPGQNEDQQGRPFVGAAGGLLQELLTRVGWRRDEVFITNVVKCRPPGNRDPEPDEIAACSGFLRRQLEVLDPAVIVTLGRFSLGTFMPGAKISTAHGTVRPVDRATGASSAVAFAMYHPAAAFRQAALKETLVADMANLPQVLLDARAARSAATGETVAHEEPRAAHALEDESTERRANEATTTGTDVVPAPLPAATMGEPTAASGSEPSPGPADIVAEPAPVAVAMIAAPIGGSSDADALDVDGQSPGTASGDPGTGTRPEPGSIPGEGTRTGTASAGAAGTVTPYPPLDQTVPDRLDADDLEALARPAVVGAGANDERDQTDQMTLF
jgi:uracil-DNA glycosylase family 4